jgi:hypothetical protein
VTKKQKLFLIFAVLGCLSCLLGQVVMGYQDWLLRSAPGSNPQSGYLRMWADSGSNLFKCVTSSGATCYFNSNSSFSYPGAGVPLSTGSAWGTSYGAQGTDANLLTAGTVSGTSALLCTDGNGGATTSSCPAGITSFTTTGSSGAASFSGGVLNIPVYSGGGGSSAPFLGLLTNTPPVLSGMSTIGTPPGVQATIYSAGVYTGIQLGQSGSTQNSQTWYLATGSTPWTVFAAVSIQADTTDGNQFVMDFLNGTTVSRGFRLVMLSGAWRITVSSNGSDLYDGSSDFPAAGQQMPFIFFLRVKDTGTTRTFALSCDWGQTWNIYYSEATSAATINNYGLHIGNQSTTQPLGAMIWAHYKTSP